MYSAQQQDKWFCIKNDSKELKTPMGQTVKTRFKDLAERLATDLNIYGESPTDPVSIVAFHYAMIDFFSMMPREELERKNLGSHLES